MSIFFDINLLRVQNIYSHSRSTNTPHFDKIIKLDDLNIVQMPVSKFSGMTKDQLIINALYLFQNRYCDHVNLYANYFYLKDNETLKEVFKELLN